MGVVISFPKLVILQKRLKKENHKRVLVTGVFDLLHREHKRFLKAAKSHGDILIVGIETDERVKKLKGLSRPIWKLEKRLQKVANLKSVDYVFSLPQKFDNFKDHERLIAKLKPQILAISSHTPHQEVKKQLLEKYDGQLVVVLPHNPKISTTQILGEEKRAD